MTIIDGFIELHERLGRDPDTAFREVIRDAAMFKVMIGNVSDNKGIEAAQNLMEVLEHQIDYHFEELKVSIPQTWAEVKGVFGDYKIRMDS